MILINLGHPLNDEHRDDIEALVQQPITRLIERQVHLDPERAFGEQVIELADAVGLSSREWQSEAIVINPPTLNVIALAMLAELHGRMGYFPPVVRLRSVSGAVPPRFAVAEILDLQGLRERARERR